MPVYKRLWGSRAGAPIRSGFTPIRLGANIDHPYNYDPGTQMYRDLVASGDGFYTSAGALVPINTTDGYPTADFKLNLQVLPTLQTLQTMNGRIKGKVASMSWSGGAATIGAYDSVNNYTPFTLPWPANASNYSTGNTLTLTGTQRSSASATNTGVQEIIVLRPGDTDFASVSARTSMFTPQYIAFISQFNGPIRFMDYKSTNNNNGPIDVGQRATPANTRTINTYTAASVDTPYYGKPDEDIYLLAAATGNDVWINIPIGATDAFVSDQASRFLAGMPTSNKIYVELSNEIWNNSFGAANITRDRACDELDGYFDQGSGAYNLASATGNGGTTVTLNFNRPHNRNVGDTVYVSKTNSNSIPTGNFTVTAVNSTTSITINLTGITGAIALDSGFTMIGKLGPSTLRAGSTLAADSTVNVYSLAYNWIVRRVTQISDLWRAVWGDAQMNGANGRVRIIFAEQQSNNNGQGFPTTANRLYNTRIPNAWVWAIAGASYAQAGAYYYPGSGTTGTEALWISALQSALTDAPNDSPEGYQWEARTITALQYGLHTIQYEYGPDTSGDEGVTNNTLKSQSEFDPSLETYYRTYLDTYYQLGGEDVVWFHAERQGVDTQGFGSWGIVTDISDTTVSPKIVAILAAIAAGKKTPTRNVVSGSGSVIDGRQSANRFVNKTPSGAFPSLSGGTARSYLLYSPSAQTLNMTIGYTCNYAGDSATISMNFSTVQTPTWSASPADQTTLKSTAPVAVTLTAGLNVVTMQPNANNGNDVLINSLTFS